MDVLGMKRTERSDSINVDGRSPEANEQREQSVAEKNDAEIAEIVDVISNDSSLLPTEMSGSYGILPLCPLSYGEDQKVNHAKRPKINLLLPKLNYNLICDRLVGTLHMPIQTPKMGRDRKDTRSTCGICGAKTTIKCSHCGVGMCIIDRDGRNCWREFHTRQVLEYKQQPKAEKKDRNRGMSSSFSDSSLVLNDLQQDLHMHNGSSSSNVNGDSNGMI